MCSSSPRPCQSDGWSGGRTLIFYNGFWLGELAKTLQCSSQGEFQQSKFTKEECIPDLWNSRPFIYLVSWSPLGQVVHAKCPSGQGCHHPVSVCVRPNIGAIATRVRCPFSICWQEGREP